MPREGGRLPAGGMVTSAAGQTRPRGIRFKLSSLPGDDIFLTLSPKSLAPHSGLQMHVPIPSRPLLVLYLVPLQRAGENCTFYRRCTYSGKERGERSFKYKTAGGGGQHSLNVASGAVPLNLGDCHSLHLNH